MRILIVDDDADFAEALRLFLHLSAHHAVVVGTGRDALALLQVQAFEVMLLDLMLPRLSGLEVMDRVSAMDLRLHVFAITGSDISDRQAKDAGFHAAMEKPVDLPRLLAAIEELS